MSRPLRKIVIGTSLTEASDEVVRTGAALARATGAAVWLVHAYLPYLPTAFASGGGFDTQLLEQQVADLQARITSQARRTGLEALPGFSRDQIRLTVGAPHREIVEIARHLEADLVVVGTAESALDILGSTADRVIRKLPCPVFAVRPGAPFPPSRVELPVDLSPISAHALRQGLDILAQIGPLTDTEALFVLNPFEVAGSLQFTPEQIQRFGDEELRRFLAANVPPGAAVPPARVRIGYPREEILASLNERKADLAVLGTQGRGGFERLMVGSVATWVLRHSRCNLLVVPPAAAASLHDEATAERWEALAGADRSYVSDEDPVAVPGG